MTLDHDTRDFLERMRQMGAPPLHTLGPHEARGMCASAAPMYGLGPDLIVVDEQAPVAGPDGTAAGVLASA